MLVSNRILLAATALTLSSVSVVAQAADASLYLNLPALNYTSSDAKAKPDGGEEAKTTETAMMTPNLENAFAAISFGKVLVYYYPWSATKMVSAGYMVTDIIEAGADIGLNSSNSKTGDVKTDSSTNVIGLYAFAYPPLGAFNGEFGLNIDSISGSEKNTVDADGATGPADPEEVKSTTSGTYMRLTANAVVPLAKNLMYVGGLWYESTALSTKEGEAKSKWSETKLGLNLVTLRMVLN